MAWIDNMTDAQLAREAIGPGQVITRDPAQIAAYRAQQSGAMGGAGSLGTIAEWMQRMGGGVNPYVAGVMPTSNRFNAGLTDVESRLKAMLDNPNSIQQSGAYKFRVKQGEEALNRSLGAKGLLYSGNRLMELTKYGQDMASQEYDNQFNRIGSLLGTYGQGYLGDKNANTNQFSAQSNAWNTAEGNKVRNNIGMAGIWADVNRGGGAVNSPVTRTISQMLPMQFLGGVR